MKVHQIIDRALDILAERGWCKDDYLDVAGRVCALGAIALALGLAPARLEAGDFHLGRELERYPDLCLALDPYTDPDPVCGEAVVEHVANINDRATRVEEVVAFLEAASERGQ